MFAVIKTGGKQLRVAANDVVNVDKLEGEAGQSVSFDQVLMVGGDAPQIGSPVVAGAVVVGEIVGQKRTRKIIAFKKRRRQNSRRKRGHRQHFTQVRITSISVGGKVISAIEGAAKPKAAKKVKTETAAAEAVSE
jgi:large subunit ribosomal protein L21